MDRSLVSQAEIEGNIKNVCPHVLKGLNSYIYIYEPSNYRFFFRIRNTPKNRNGKRSQTIQMRFIYTKYCYCFMLTKTRIVKGFSCNLHSGYIYIYIDFFSLPMLLSNRWFFGLIHNPYQTRHITVFDQVLVDRSPGKYFLSLHASRYS